MAKSLMEQLAQEMEKRRVKTPKLARELDIPKDRIYKWFQDGTNPKEQDSIKIRNWISGEMEQNVSKDKAHPISVDELAGVILRTYALQQVSLSVLAELYAEKKNSSVTATLSELLKAVEGEEVKMRDAIQAL